MLSSEDITCCVIEMLTIFQPKLLLRSDGAASGREVIQGEEITYKTVEEKEADEGAHRTFYLDSGIAASGTRWGNFSSWRVREHTR